MTPLVATLYLGRHFVLKRGSNQGMQIPDARFAELAATAGTGETVPDWLADGARRLWDVDLAGALASTALLVRKDSPHGYSRGSYEVNLGCNYDCEHCYLATKRFEGLDWPDRKRLLDVMCEAGVVYLQVTGGEPLVDQLFKEVYTYAFDLGMLISISTKGSRLWREDILDLLISRPVHKLTVSVYGATPDPPSPTVSIPALLKIDSTR